MTYSHLFPDTKLYVVPTNTQNITSGNWYNTERGRQVVLGELRKCGEYFENYIKDISSSQSEWCLLFFSEYIYLPDYILVAIIGLIR